MRLGGGIERPYSNPEQWLALVKELGYRAVICPVDHRASAQEKADYKACIQANDLVLGEVGAWSNPLSPDDMQRREAVTYCQNQLALAEEMQASCCVNIAGSRGAEWDGAYPDNYGKDTYALIVDSVREIIDGVSPQYTSYTLEPMPWMIPDSPDAYLQLLKDVDRKAFGVHLDYTNMINSPYKYLHSSEFIRECFTKLGPYIKSVHAKDVSMDLKALPCHIREVMPGQGTIDFGLVIRESRKLGESMTVYVEHLSSFEEYKQAAEYVRSFQ